MKKIGILFDLDGTLLDTLQDLTDATNYTLRHYDFPERTVDEVRRFIGNGARQLVRRSMPDGVSEDEVDTALAFYQQYYKNHCQEKTAPYPGILEALRTLAEKYPIAIVSNKPDTAVKPLCEEYFPGVFALGEQAGCPRKPAPDMLLLAQRQLGVEKFVYVGDSEVDVITSQNAQMPCLSVTWGFRDEETLRAAGASHLCRDTAELAYMLDALIGEINGQ